jgi:hypothetical protein
MIQSRTKEILNNMKKRKQQMGGNTKSFLEIITINLDDDESETRRFACDIIRKIMGLLPSEEVQIEGKKCSYVIIMSD